MKRSQFERKESKVARNEKVGTKPPSHMSFLHLSHRPNDKLSEPRQLFLSTSQCRAKVLPKLSCIH